MTTNLMAISIGISSAELAIGVALMLFQKSIYEATNYLVDPATDPNSLIIIALIVAVAPTVSAIAALVVSLRQSKIAAETVVKVDQVHALVNSQMTALRAELSSSNAALSLATEKISALTKAAAQSQTISDLKESAARGG